MSVAASVVRTVQLGYNVCVVLCCVHKSMCHWPCSAGGVNPPAVITAGEREDNEW